MPHNYIGSISEHVLSHDEKKDRKPKMKLSEQLRIEREALFGITKKEKRKFKKVLPRSKNPEKRKFKKLEIEELEKTAQLILQEINERKQAQYIFDEVKNAENNKAKHIRMAIAYILYQCYHIGPKQISNYFKMHYDIIGSANRKFERLFASQPSEQVFYYSLIDFFMEINKREYQ